jgi:hypothetical protein
MDGPANENPPSRAKSGSGSLRRSGRSFSSPADAEIAFQCIAVSVGWGSLHSQSCCCPVFLLSSLYFFVFFPSHTHTESHIYILYICTQLMKASEEPVEFARRSAALDLVGMRKCMQRTGRPPQMCANIVWELKRKRPC